MPPHDIGRRKCRRGEASRRYRSRKLYCSEWEFHRKTVLNLRAWRFVTFVWRKSSHAWDRGTSGSIPRVTRTEGAIDDHSAVGTIAITRQIQTKKSVEPFPPTTDIIN
jgi:hypothetical protein